MTGPEERWISWPRVERRLRNADHYWLATTRADGRPHATPIWGAWVERLFYFTTEPESQKGCNMTHQPYAVIHLDSGADVIVVEGMTTPLRSREERKAPIAALCAKYTGQLEGPDDLEEAGIYQLTPELAHAWFEGEEAETRSRWKLADAEVHPAPRP